MMGQTNRPQFAAELLALAEGIDVELSERRIDIYWRVLQGYDWLVVQAGLAAAMRRKWYKFPQPGELIELIEGSLKERSEQAWLELNEMSRDYGPHHGLLCEDPVLAEAIRILWVDWIDACKYLKRGQQEGAAAIYALHQDFVQAYRLATERNLIQTPIYFAGLREVWGEKSLSPIRIGRSLRPLLLTDESMLRLSDKLEEEKR